MRADRSPFHGPSGSFEQVLLSHVLRDWVTCACVSQEWDQCLSVSFWLTLQYIRGYCMSNLTPLVGQECLVRALLPDNGCS